MNVIAGRGHTAAFPATPTSANQATQLEAPIYTWNDSHVSRWLANIKCANHADAFKHNDIRGDVLLELDQITLREMGIASIGDRLRIINAVKALRQKAPQRPTVLINANTDYLRSSQEPGPSKQSPTSRLGARSRPAPLQLSSNSSQHNNLPHIMRDGSAPDSARINHPVRPLPQPNHSYSGSTTPAPPGSARINLPPLPPVPHSRPPPPPARPSNNRLTPGSAHSSGRRTPTQGDAPQYTNQPLPPAPGAGQSTPVTGTSNVNWSGYGLPSDPRPPAGGRSQSPLPPLRGSSKAYNGTAPVPPPPGRNPSLSSSPVPAAKVPIRAAPAAHPYATASAPSALQPGNAAVVAASQLAYNLSPIAESFHSSTPSPPTGGGAGGYSIGRGPYNNNNNRPNTPSGNNNAPSHKIVKFVLSDEGHSRKIDVADCVGGVEILEKALKKFDLGGRHDGTMNHVETNDGGLVVDGWAVYVEWQGEVPAVALTETELMAVCHAPSAARDKGLTLRKITRPKRTKALAQIFGESPPTTNRYEHSNASGGLLGVEDADPNGLLTPGYSKTSFESEAPQGTGRAAKRASAISILSGLGVRDPERALEPPSSPGRPPSPVSPAESSLSPSSATRSPTTGNAKKPSKLRNFFGQRPPSELIATHLHEYFPLVEKKVLERTARHSMMRTSGVGRRESLAIGGGNRRTSMAGGSTRDSTVSWNPTSRFSSSTIGSGGDSTRVSLDDSRADTQGRSRSSTYTQATAIEDLPRVSLSTDDGRSVDLDGDEHQSMNKPELPPVTFTSESLIESLENLTGGGDGRENRRLSSQSMNMANPSKRFSYMTELRSKRDRSDTASLMTVDEITASVESRRESMALGDRPEIESDWTDVNVVQASEDGDGGLRDSTVSDSTTLVHPLPDAPEDSPAAPVDENEEEEEFSEEEEEHLSEEETDEDEDTPSKAVASKGGSKWIKGALIGAGSFGQVYLGMDASSGLLMAVKQVEMPTGSGPNQDRKQSMLTALELEIELLKELQHANIVQYLYSSLDDGFLNIFLEYVPGGSVTALLRSYGAFEETLVKNFVRQILQGLDYLHSRDIIHRDIKGGNILVDNKGGIKISDFGISKKVDSIAGGNRNRPSLQGSVFWMAPEVVKQKAHTRKADIWSVGCLVVEMLTGEHPWAQLTQMQAIFKIGSSAKPTVPSDISVEAQDFLEKTFDLDYAARPDAVDLLQHPWIAVVKKTKTKEPKVVVPTADS